MPAPYLPTVPTDEEKFAFIEPRGSWLGLVGLISLATFCLITVRSFHPNLLFALYACFAALYFVRVAFWAFGAFFAKPFDYDRHQKYRSVFDQTPSVDIFLPNCGEDIAVIVNQLKAVRDIDYPNYRVYVLDDKGRDDVWFATEALGFHYISREDKGYLKKAGNLRHAFAQTSGELILVLDADFVPRPDILTETVFRFQMNQELAILQTPQYFNNATSQKNQTPAQLGLGFFQEAFYRLVQNFRDRAGAAICCGSCAIYRRTALEPHGGGAPVERSEDVHTGWMLLSDGWTVEYLPLNLSAGLSPEGIKSLFNQHYRWCSGSYSLTCSEGFWGKPNIPLRVKWIYYSAFHYYTTSGLGVLLHAIPIFLGLWIAADIPNPFVARIGSSSIVLVLVASALWAKSRWGLFVPVMGMAVSYTHLVALLDVIFGEIAPWVPSGVKSASNGRFERFIWLIATVPALLFGIALSIALYRHVEFQRAVFPVGWMGLQMVVSWLVLAELRHETK